MEQIYMLRILYGQYHACWCPGDLRIQDTSMHSIGQISRNIPSLASEELSWWFPSIITLNDKLYWSYAGHHTHIEYIQ